MVKWLHPAWAKRRLKPTATIFRQPAAIRLFFMGENSHASGKLAGAISIVSFIFLSVIIYSNSFLCSFHLDDVNSILTNPSISDIRNLAGIWNSWPTRFITYLSIAVNYYFNGLSVWGYHLFNFIVHILCGILVWWIVLLTLSCPAMHERKIAEGARIIAFFAGLVFLTHPVQTEGVTYIIQRATSLATLFYLASLCLYIKSRVCVCKNKDSVAWRIYYTASLIAGILAIFTKEISITLPIIILLYSYYFLRDRGSGYYRHLLPFFFLLLIMVVVMMLTGDVSFRQMHRLTEDQLRISQPEYLLTQFRVMVTYMRLLFIPLNQNLDYDYPIAPGIFAPGILLSLVVLVLIISSAIRLASRHRLISFGILWFFLTLLPESSIIPINDVIFEHRLYLAMPGFAIFLVCGLYDVFVLRQRRILVFSLIMLSVIAAYSIMAHERNSIWKDDITLWSDVIRKSPMKARGYINRGYAHQISGDPDAALADYKKAIELNPFHAGTYSNMGVIYREQGQIDLSIEYFNRALEVAPGLSGVYYNRGYAYHLRGDFDRAISDYNMALEIDPNYVDAYNNRGNTYLRKGDIDKALADYRKALEISPDYAPSRQNIERLGKRW